MADPSGKGQPSGDQAQLLARLVAEDWRERQSAVDALVRLDRLDLARSVLELIRQDHTNLSTLSAGLQVLERVGHSLIGELAGLLHGPDLDLRIYAALALGQLGGPQAAQALLEALLDTNQPENVRFNAIEALGQMRAGPVRAQSVDALRDILRTSTPFLRYAALVALGLIGQPLPVEDLLPLVNDEYLAEPAILTLGQAGDPQAGEQIARAVAGWLESGKGDAALAVQAMAALAKRQDPSRITRLQGAFLEGLGQKGEQCLLKVMDSASLECKQEDPFWGSLALVLTWLAEQRPAVRRVLVRLLAYPEARPLVEKALAQEATINQEEVLEDLAEVVRAAVNLGANGEAAEAAEPAYSAARLLSLAKSPTGSTVAVEAVAVEALIFGLSAEDETLAALAAEGLGRLRAPRAIDPLWSLLDHPSALVRRAAAQAVTNLPVPGLLERAAGLSRQPDPRRREAALALLVWLDEPSGTQAVLEALEDPFPAVRRAAVDLLPRLADPRIPAAMARALDDPDANLRRAAAQASAALPDEIALPLLQRAAQDPDGWVRMYAVRGIGQHAIPQSLPALVACLDDPLPPVRAAVVQALALLDQPGLAEEQRNLLHESIRGRLNDADEEVRRCAQEALGGGA